MTSRRSRQADKWWGGTETPLHIHLSTLLLDSVKLENEEKQQIDQLGYSYKEEEQQLLNLLRSWKISQPLLCHQPSPPHRLGVWFPVLFLPVSYCFSLLWVVSCAIQLEFNASYFICWILQYALFVFCNSNSFLSISISVLMYLEKMWASVGSSVVPQAWLIGLVRKGFSIPLFVNR